MDFVDTELLMSSSVIDGVLISLTFNKTASECALIHCDTIVPAQSLIRAGTVLHNTTKQSYSVSWQKMAIEMHSVCFIPTSDRKKALMFEYLSK